MPRARLAILALREPVQQLLSCFSERLAHSERLTAHLERRVGDAVTGMLARTIQQQEEQTAANV
jgi:hypothetical protein